MPYILIVDDEPMIRMTLRRYFLFHGFEVDDVVDLATARASIARRRPDAVLLDKNLPDGSGLDLLAELHSAGSDVPVFVITGYASRESAERAKQLGAAGYIEKPYDLAELRNAVIDKVNKQQ